MTPGRRPPPAAVPSQTDGADGDQGLLKDRLERSLARHVSPITARSVMLWIGRRQSVAPEDLGALPPAVLIDVFERALSLYLSGEDKQLALDDLRQCLNLQQASAKSESAISMAIQTEADVAIARTAALRLALAAGFDKPDAVKVSTVVSELSRNILQYAGSGVIDVNVLFEPRRAVRVVATDHGPGILGLDLILAGKYRSKTGMGLGLAGSKRLMDDFEVVTAPQSGTRIVATKYR